ncbi:tRNA glutamyl-Q(34) synthetase GluQRS [Paucibacter sp. TC2R-5]|uniref:tRNA glutamyl-Q(34) synthetase GluQRS n=1 Tax=Paucibacter sp. TC2R-5 TaxID=2893555 RepID=UPI0021E4DFF5|nr:tRNA glutamyl-Q(34) synthetase GluQRS [Paucibacter sp. TC2R-5]MCV2358985.1 tRNA glutamyl-Q(34) synthetase GluQRS [Paucibacter sp. TC2R-5]
MYIGRFAPSPTGPLHAGSLVAALASWLDARAHGGRWLIRIEDVDGPRCPPGTDRLILDQLAQCGLHPDEPPLWQSARGALYEQALRTLQLSGWAYGCACSRKQIAEALQAQGLHSERHGELVYPGTCRTGLHGQAARAWRLRSTAVLAGTEDLTLNWLDRRMGSQTQNLSKEVGDFVLKRADGLWAYQLAVVVDDAAQGITDIVRGADLADNTPRQIRLQQLLGLPTPRYLHTPLVLGADGSKLSKQNGAAALELGDAALALRLAASVLGLQVTGGTVAEVLAQALERWQASFGGMMPATAAAKSSSLSKHLKEIP